MLSSFLIATLVGFKTPESKKKILKEAHCPRININSECKNISAVSLLYQYTNTPPLAYGSPAPKVAESIIRSQKYNTLPNNGRDTCKNKDRQYWTSKDGEFPANLQNPTSNVHLPSMKEYCREFVREYHNEIDECARKLLLQIKTENSDTLTRGRQTWEPFSQRSVPSPDAYKEMLEFFEKNTGKTNFTMIEWIESWSSLFDNEVIYYKKKVTKKVKKRFFDKTKNMFVYKTSNKHEDVWEKMVGDDARSFLFMIATEFCSYLKSKERSKLKRRAICSANMILRMYFEIIERFHLSLGKVIRGSTISKGGVDKQNKIMEGLSSLVKQSMTMLATEDATKWNECLSPACFLVMHNMFLSTYYREEMGLESKLTYEDSNTLLEIFNTGIYLLSKKRIFIGQGHVLENGEFFSRHKWYEVDTSCLNAHTREWYEEIRKDLDSRDCIYSPYGMLMGMLNGASTTYGLVPTIGMKATVSSIRSSDDSITMFTGDTMTDIWNDVVKLYTRYKMIGINISTKKSRFFRWPFGEYTSWYIDGEFTSQYGVEISTIRPSGDTPHTDFHTAAMETNVSLREYRINNIGAEMMLALKIANVRRLWRIKKCYEQKRKDVRNEILLLADGGLNPWHSTNTHLAEIPLKEYNATPIEKEYLLKIMSPDNPFSDRETEKLSYSKEVGAVINAELEIPRNVFCFVRRPNKTLKSTYKIKEKKEMEAAKCLIELSEIVEPSMCLATPNRQIKFKSFIKNNIQNHITLAHELEDEESIKLSQEVASLYSIVFGADKNEDAK
uniref:RNA-directed RNA polymerase catalytic subunit n=1 Tax=Soybean thrips quaranja-like virus 2 TaxID=2796551 RepID=A0A7T3R0N5_9ORTO|nr:putative polymerase PB1 [Soybean thrips quaranja-like virus 2]